ncbi:CheR family methyltransferase [Urbifossiella limnaea]|uniref:protein-glutamate O-methyltransferase n=1 Tax=Urbifossiella limnaea TaxID=2528023 RepID=A0A517XWU3_9BACT|nr:protein-glutamate O-methyltransferase CheR [Urbifossiella limnaea]QDU21973.1 Chemotaxis protein methyltransferase Cher2 [Urbifossiella limnaea]
MTAQDFEYVCRFVRDRSAIVLDAGKEYLVESRLSPLAAQLRLGSVGDLIGQLRTGRDAGLGTRVIEAMVTNETLFFRDVQPFDTLRRVVLPELIRRREAERRLSVWCAACSTGQEPYSLAMLIREYFPALVTWHVNILATDLSAEVLARARDGRYSQLEVNRGLPAAFLLKYFRQQGGVWELADDMRRMVEFRELNLVREWPSLPRFDLVFLRNVMIYFDVGTKKAILDRVARVLRPDGYLLLGAAESTINLADSFRRAEELKGGFYQSVG